MPAGGELALAPQRLARSCARAISGLLLALLRLYQLILSPFLSQLMGPGCRFQPSCSEYAKLAIRAHGPLQGTALAARRLCRCHPFHPGGFDPPPVRRS